MIFEPFTLKGVTFKNRLLRSSMGGRLAYYDGTINGAWKNFELSFAEGGVAGLISATLNVGPQRWSPLEYPQLSNDKFVKPLADGIRRIHALDCRYIIQIGDAGYHTQTSLFSQAQDEKSASNGFDLLYGYRNVRRAMTIGEVKHLVEQLATPRVGCERRVLTAWRSRRPRATCSNSSSTRPSITGLTAMAARWRNGSSC